MFHEAICAAASVQRFAPLLSTASSPGAQPRPPGRYLLGALPALSSPLFTALHSPGMGVGGGADSHHVISTEGVGSSFWPPALSPFFVLTESSRYVVVLTIASLVRTHCCRGARFAGCLARVPVVGLGFTSWPRPRLFRLSEEKFCALSPVSLCRGARCRGLSSHVPCAVGQGSQAALPEFLSWGSASPVRLAPIAPSLSGVTLCTVVSQLVGGARLRRLSSHGISLRDLSDTVWLSRGVSIMRGGGFSPTPRHGESPPNGGGLVYPTMDRRLEKLNFCLSLVKGGFP